MKVRVITALVLVAILAVVFIFLDTLLLNAVIGFVAILALWELLNATGILKHKGLTVLTMIQALAIAFFRAGYIGRLIIPIFLVILLGYFTLLVKNYGVLGIDHLAMAFMFGTLVPMFFSCAIYLRDDHGVVLGGYYLLIALGSGWLSDTGAYFVGSKFGKHKLAPRVSPNKTVEGSVGGLVSCLVLTLLLSAVYAWLMGALGHTVTIRYGAVALLSPLFAIVGMLGDLSASAIKRQFGVKDFGHIMPGHGGILDRFDSVMFTLPTVYAVVRHIGLISLA